MDEYCVNDCGRLRVAGLECLVCFRATKSVDEPVVDEVVVSEPESEPDEVEEAEEAEEAFDEDDFYDPEVD